MIFRDRGYSSCRQQNIALDQAIQGEGPEAKFVRLRRSTDLIKMAIVARFDVGFDFHGATPFGSKSQRELDLVSTPEQGGLIAAQLWPEPSLGPRSEIRAASSEQEAHRVSWLRKIRAADRPNWHGEEPETHATRGRGRRLACSPQAAKPRPKIRNYRNVRER